MVDVTLEYAIDYISDEVSRSEKYDAIEELMIRLPQAEMYFIAHIANKIVEDWNNGDME